MFASLLRMRLESSIKFLKWLVLRGLPTREHDEKPTSLNMGNFLELLQFLVSEKKSIRRVALENALQNCQMIALSIQKDIINCCAKETTNSLLEELDDDFFPILADESADVVDKEQLALCLRYVNKRGQVIERFLGVVHVRCTTSLILKNAIESLLVQHSLSLGIVRGQCYDGASNMREANGLKTLMMNETPSAYYVHCFSHKLQLTLNGVVKKNSECCWLFEDVLPLLLNFFGSSPKRKEFLREKQKELVVEALSLSKIE